MWRSLVAHLTGGQGVAGSNPVIPTVFSQVRGPFRLGGAALELSRFPRSRSLGGPHDLDELLDGGCPSQTRARLEEAACEPHTCPRLGKGIGSIDAHGW